VPVLEPPLVLPALPIGAPPVVAVVPALLVVEPALPGPPPLPVLPA
jgi:hypothetical protein